MSPYLVVSGNLGFWHRKAGNVIQNSYRKNLDNFLIPREDIIWDDCRPIFDPWWSRVLIDHAIADDLRLQHRASERSLRDHIYQEVAQSIHQINQKSFEKWMNNFSVLSDMLPLSCLKKFAPFYAELCLEMRDDLVGQRKIMIRGVFRAMQVPHTAFCNKHMNHFLHSAPYFYAGETLLAMAKSHAMRLRRFADQTDAALQTRIIAMVRALQLLPANDVGNLFGGAEEYAQLLQILRALVLEFEINLPDFMSITPKDVEKILDISPSILPVGIA